MIQPLAIFSPRATASSICPTATAEVAISSKKRAIRRQRDRERVGAEPRLDAAMTSVNIISLAVVGDNEPLVCTVLLVADALDGISRAAGKSWKASRASRFYRRAGLIVMIAPVSPVVFVGSIGQRLKLVWTHANAIGISVPIMRKLLARPRTEFCHAISRQTA